MTYMLLLLAVVVVAPGVRGDVLGDLLNPIWLRDAVCPYGTLPGLWNEIPAQYAMVRPPGAHLPQLIDTNTSFVGGRYQLLDKHCQLKNRFREYLFDPPPTNDAKPLLVAMFGDSVDSQTLEHTCWTDAREHGQNVTHIAAQSLASYCVDHGLSCLTSPGTHYLTMQCMTRRARLYSRVVPSLHPDFNWTDLKFIPPPQVFEEVRDFMRTDSGSGDPDFIILGVHFWELKNLIDNMRPVPGITNDTAVLPRAFMEEQYELYSDLLRKLRSVFRKSLIMVRTVGFPLHSVDNGRTATFRQWGHRMWVSQMNQVIRAVSGKHNVPLVDMAAMVEGFVPQQAVSPGDTHHPAHWLNLEAFNVALNIYHDYKQAKELARHRRRQ